MLSKALLLIFISRLALCSEFDSNFINGCLYSRSWPKSSMPSIYQSQFHLEYLEDIIGKIFPCDNKFQILARRKIRIFGQNSISRTDGTKNVCMSEKIDHWEVEVNLITVFQRCEICSQLNNSHGGPYI